MPAVTRARVFQSGNSQAVRLPKAFWYRSLWVEIFSRGTEVVLRESPATLEDTFDLLAATADGFLSSGRKDVLPLEKRARFKG